MNRKRSINSKICVHHGFVDEKYDQHWMHTTHHSPHTIITELLYRKYKIKRIMFPRQKRKRSTQKIANVNVGNIIVRLNCYVNSIILYYSRLFHFISLHSALYRRFNVFGFDNKWWREDDDDVSICMRVFVAGAGKEELIVSFVVLIRIMKFVVWSGPVNFSVQILCYVGYSCP